MARLVKEHLVLPMTVGICPLTSVYSTYDAAEIKALGNKNPIDVIFTEGTKLQHIGFAYDHYVGASCKCYNQLSIVVLQPAGKATTGKHYYAHPLTIPGVVCSRCPYDPAELVIPREFEPIVEFGTGSIFSEEFLAELIEHISSRESTTNRYALLDLE